MENLRCIKHRDYRGEKAPVLSCKACCSIYIAAIKKMQLAQQQSSGVNAVNDGSLANVGNQSFNLK